MAQTAGTNTTLKGSLSGTIAENDVLTLKFLSPAYTPQDCTLEYIATHCDYATATVTVTPESFTNEFFVAVPAISGKAVSLMATTSAGENSYSVSGVTFERGKFYAIKVRMSNVIHVKNQSELTAAVETSGHVLPLLRAQTHLDLTSALGK